MPSRLAAPLLAVIVATTAAPAVAAERASDAEPPRLVLQGGSDGEIAVYGLGAIWPLPLFADTLSRHGLNLRMAADVLRWDARKSGETGNGFLWDVGITPYLRWRPADTAWHGFFVQGGLGLHLVSHTTIDPGRQLSTAFQFGEALAVGVNFGPRNRYEITAFARHVSNGDIEKPNWGFTYYGATLGIPLD